MATREEQMIEEIKLLKNRIIELEKKGADDSRVRALEEEVEHLKKELKEKKEAVGDEDEVIFDPW